MVSTNPIRRGLRGHGKWARRDWFAVCPECHEEVTHCSTYPHYARATRKNTKDALHRHARERHTPGPVGR